MLAISWPDSLHGLLPFFFWPHRVQLPESVSATPVLPFPPLRALPHDESNLCGESRYTAFGEFSIGHNTEEHSVRAPMFKTPNTRHLEATLAGDSFSACISLDGTKLRITLKEEFRSPREDRCDLKVDEYETKWFVGKINNERNIYDRSRSFSYSILLWILSGRENGLATGLSLEEIFEGNQRTVSEDETI